MSLLACSARRTCSPAQCPFAFSSSSLTNDVAASPAALTKIAQRGSAYCPCARLASRCDDERMADHDPSGDRVAKQWPLATHTAQEVAAPRHA